MKTMVPARFLAPMVLLLGVAVPASAQTPSSTAERVGCYIDLTDVAKVPSPFNARLMTTDSSVHCPGNKPPPNIQVDCDLLIGPGWTPGLKINTKNHRCLIDGEQCGFTNPVQADGLEGFLSDNTHLQINPVKIDGEVFGDAKLRCQNKNGS